MIDTLRFQIDVEDEIRSIIKLKSNEINSRDNTTGLLTYKIYRKDINLGSHDYHVNIILSSDDKLYLEFSAPKVYFGHNVYLLYPHLLEDVLIKVHGGIESFFSIKFPSYRHWRVQRLDICYAWRFNSQDDAYLGMLALEAFDYPRKKKKSFDSGFEVIGTTYDLKVYMKYNEFLTHDFKRFYDRGKDADAQNFAELANSVLRIETTLRKKYLKYLFNKDVYFYDINNMEFLISQLNKHFRRLTKKLEREIIGYKKVVDVLFGKYGPVQAWNLLYFYNFYYPQNNVLRRFNRSLLKNRRNRSTCYRRHKDLADANIGILDPAYDLRFQFSIPSDFVVNKEKDDIAQASV